MGIYRKRRLGWNLVDNRVGEAAYSKGCAVFILQVMDRSYK